MSTPDDLPTGDRSFYRRRAFVLILFMISLVLLYTQVIHGRLSWDQFLEHRTELRSLVDDSPCTSRVLYFLLYLAIAAVAVPITPVLSIMGGFLFGFWQAIALVSFGSTAGASVALLLSRYLFRDLVERHWGRRLEPIQRGLAKDGAFYLLALRLSPFVPFSLVNIGMGVTRIRLQTFWWVSQLGMLPIAVVFVNAGAEVGRIERPEDLLSPELLLSLSLVALVPLGLRLAWVRWRRSTQPLG